MFPRQINDFLWILGNDYFHIYLIKGKNASALVEIGISATAEITWQQLSSLGVKPDYLIITHPHSDHITGLDYLKRSLPRATVIAGRGAESFITHPKAAKSIIEEDLHLVEAMTCPGLCNYPARIKYPPELAGCRVVNDGETLNLGDLTIDFLEAKGHAPGNILVYIHSMDIILVSDSLGNYYPGRGFFPTFFTGLKNYLETIDRLEKYNLRYLGLAHNGFFSSREEIKDIFHKARKSVNDVQNYIIDNINNEEELAKELFGFYYTDELAIYSPQNILNCCHLLVRRVREMYKV